ncbi:hypothetical protein INT43_005229 [Umbelopsis isabellina]|uniref:Myb-like domain-containing protein n=1 Tax=Mortierella isabellina TaxID=91625 RepID=A0A8H7PHT0_MORIS|nr:hypothetical protein INT43_005229 [Umbelopsis isabellina]
MFTGKDIPAEKRWYVVGAYQAGASERQCARLSGLSKTAVHGIIKAFSETGSPLTNRQLGITNSNAKRKLSLEYESIDLARRSSADYEVVGFSPEVVKRRKSVQVGELAHIPQYTASNAHRPLPEEDSQSIFSKRLMSRPLTPPSDTEKSDVDDKSSATATNWSLADDRALLENVLKRHQIHMEGLESKLRSKHSPTDCTERWGYLRDKILNTYASPRAANHM